MMKGKRKQKKREINKTAIAVRQMLERYTQVVDDYFVYSEWISIIMPKYTDYRFDGIVKWFITQTLLYLQVFMKKDKDDMGYIEIGKDEFIKLLSINEVFDSIKYSEDFTCEMVREIFEVCLNNFLNNTMFPVVDVKESSAEFKFVKSC
jgi:hypothetical protein